MTQHSASPAVMRSKLGQARGLGSAKAGFHHWWGQKLTSFALLPLSLWFVTACIRQIGHTRAEVAHWVANPLVATLFVLLLAATFQHLALGVEAVIVDYVREEKRKLASILIVKAACVLLALIGIISVLKLAVTG